MKTFKASDHRPTAGRTAIGEIGATDTTNVVAKNRPTQDSLALGTGAVRKTNELDQLAELEAARHLREVSREQWEYYANHVNAGTNYLPPDNVRILPADGARNIQANPAIVDHRTSPTNIGLYMLSAVAAEKLGFIDRRETLARLRDTVDAIKKLPKYEKDGVEHLYNWYSIAGEPQEIGGGFISTVDNGNFVAFLMAVETAIGDADPALSRDLGEMIAKMRFDVLYDPDQQLLYHGAYAKDGQLHYTGGHYDMIITEARCAMAVAIMQGQIPPASWTNMKRKLGKELDNINVNKTLDFQAYTGTMFEYLMPRLLMKHRGTPLGAADEQAVRVQMADVAGGLWGRSEANSNTSKGYAAWGSKALSQSKEFTTSGDEVIAPYACQMAAELAPVAVSDNLKKMDAAGLHGRYGYYESCTVKKNNGAVEYDLTPQFYAHHIGMGFVGMANALAGNIVTDWFHGSKHNRAGALENLLATPTANYRAPATKRTAEKIITNAYAYEAPITYDKTTVIGNGQFVAYAAPVGASTWTNKDYALSHNETIYLRDNSTGQILPLDDAGGLKVKVEVSMAAEAGVKLSKVTIENPTGVDRDVAVTGYLDWILDDINAYLNHPVYRNLYVETNYDEKNGIITARRRTTQGPEQEKQPFGFFAIAGKRGAKPDWAESSRTNVLGRLGSLAAPRAVVEGKSKGEFGATLDPAAALSQSVKIPAGKKTEVTFVTGFADQEQNIPALAGRKGRLPKNSRAVPHYPPDPTHAKMRELATRTERDLRIKATPVLVPEVKPEELGHWSKDGRTFVVDKPLATKKPWSMVVSNGEYGFVATAGGWAYSFGANSQQARLTPYIPDATSELPLRGVLVKNGDKIFSIAPNPAPAAGGDYRVEMSPGSIKYLYRGEDGLALSLTMFVASDQPVEFWKIDVDNQSGAPVDLELSSFLKWAEGASGSHTVIGGDRPAHENKLHDAPGDPFSGLSVELHVEAGQKKQLAFTLGQAKNLDKYDSIAKVSAELEVGTKKINSKLDGLQVQTPDPSIDALLNTWLPYQAYYAHYLARSGFYQSGGAFGFRDQLQTVMNLLSTGNRDFHEVAKKHIVETTRHQFEGGHVQHWWHPHNNLGQQSTISDNLLWLPYALANYLDVTGDRTILDVQTPFSKASRDLRPGELDFCEPMGFTESTASVYEHAKRAIDLVIDQRIGEHGLPLIGKGDWNDGLDRVGHLGKGESVWLAFFLYDVLQQFAGVAEKNNDPTTAAKYRAKAGELKTNIGAHAFNGDYFVRAWADSGEKIDFNDAIVQAWSVLSGAADPEQAKSAVAAAVKSLYKPDDKMILLFDRVLDKEPWGGALAAYPNGLRENNAQYTHGSSWLPRAVAELGDGDLALELYKAMLPTTHANDPRYGAEPYVVAADIYGGDKAGEGGWTWYSGGPGWIYRTGVEKILGLQFRNGDELFFDPCLPKKWPGFSATHKQGRATYNIEVKNPEGVSTGVRSLRLDGTDLDPAQPVRLRDDGKTHTLEVILGAR